MMNTCVKCGKKSTETHDCEHTEEKEYCIECYTELHYYLTDPHAQ